MKKLIVIIFHLFFSFSMAFAQVDLNSDPDSIVGEYEVLHQGECAKVRVTKEKDSTYTAQLYWVDDMYDKHGKIRLDKRNPDRSLRGQVCDEIVLMKGLKYNPDKKKWGDTKLYDPTRGVRAHVTCEFKETKGLRVKMSFLCFAQTCYWRKLDSQDSQIL